MGNVNREPTQKEMDEMKRIVAAGMEEGVAGISTGLFYTPGFYASTYRTGE